MAYYGNDTDEKILNNENFVIYAGDGDDYIREENHSLNGYGGNGDDTIYSLYAFGYLDAWGGYGSDYLIANKATVSCNLNGDEGNDNIVGGTVDDYLYGGQDNDGLEGENGNDTIYGGDGDDGGPNVYEAGSPFFSVPFSAGLRGGSGDDYLDGGRGDDTLYGDEDADTLLGGEGNDTLDGGTGIDRMSGGAGNDTYTVDSTRDAVVEAENDGADTVNSSISLTLAANVEALTLTGATAINGTGNALNNKIVGNSAANTLNGAAGADQLLGGDGADRFVIVNLADSTVASTGRDTIRDFRHSQGDHIDLRFLDANSAASGDQAFSFIGATAFGHHAGELRAVTSGGYTTVYGDVNGDAVADFSVLTNATTFVAGDFLL